MYIYKCIYYWSLAQDKYYEDYNQIMRTVLSIDATGCILKPVGTSNIAFSKQIFLYSSVMQ